MPPKKRGDRGETLGRPSFRLSPSSSPPPRGVRLPNRLEEPDEGRARFGRREHVLQEAVVGPDEVPFLLPQEKEEGGGRPHRRPPPPARGSRGGPLPGPSGASEGGFLGSGRKPPPRRSGPHRRTRQGSPPLPPSPQAVRLGQPMASSERPSSDRWGWLPPRKTQAE